MITIKETIIKAYPTLCIKDVKLVQKHNTGFIYLIELNKPYEFTKIKQTGFKNNREYERYLLTEVYCAITKNIISLRSECSHLPQYRLEINRTERDKLQTI